MMTSGLAMLLELLEVEHIQMSTPGPDSIAILTRDDGAQCTITLYEIAKVYGSLTFFSVDPNSAINTIKQIILQKFEEK